MSEWKAESKEPKAILLLVKINEEIILRESLINSLKFALEVMDKKYWQYCVERIKATEAGHTLKSEILALLYNQLIDSQKHVAVLIAHIRSLAINIIEQVKLLRNLHSRNVKTSAPISIYWKNQNYLLKIRTDLDFINETITIRLWLGFTARDLIIPPHTIAASAAAAATTTSTTSTVLNSTPTNLIITSNPHDPKAHWLRTHRKVYKDWFKKHEAFIKASWKAGKSKVIFKRDRKFLEGEENNQNFNPSYTSNIPIQAMFSPALTPAGTLSPSVFDTPISSRSEVLLHPLEAISASWDENDHLMQSEYTQRGLDLSHSASEEFTMTPSAANFTQRGLDISHCASEEFTMTPPMTNRKESEASVIDKPNPNMDTSNAVQDASGGANESNDASFTAEMIHTDIPSTTAATTTATPAVVSDAIENHNRIELCYSEDSSYSAMSTPFGGGAFAFSPRAETETTSNSPFPISPSRSNPFPVGLVEGIAGEESEITGIAMSSKVSTESDAATAALNNNTTTTTATIVPPVTVPSTNTATASASSVRTGSEQYQQQHHSSTPSADVGSSILASRSGTGDIATMNSSTNTANIAEHNSNINTDNTSSSNKHLVPEWLQLREYVKHSWGRIQIQEDEVGGVVHESDNTDSDYKSHGFIDIKHGLNESHDGINESNRVLNPGSQRGFIDTKHGINEAVIGFQDSLTQQPPPLQLSQQPQQQYNNNIKKELSYIYVQNKHISSKFWGTIDHNPLVIEAATGFEECFPSIYLVPPMPCELLSKAEKCSNILKKEYELSKKIEKEKKECLEYKQYIQSQVSVETLNNYIYSQNPQTSQYVSTTDVTTTGSTTTMNKTIDNIQKHQEYSNILKLRQQGSTELLKGISMQHLSNSISIDSSSTIILQNENNKNKEINIPNQLIIDNNNIFLTNLQEYNDSELLLPLQSQQLQSQLNDEYNEKSLSLLQPNQSLYGNYIDINQFHSFRIEESSKLKQKLENKVLESRKIIEYKENELFPTIRSEYMGKREPNHYTIQWYNYHIIKIQTLIRMFLSKRKIRKIKVMQKFHRSAQKVRTLVIGFMWRYRQRQKYWEQRFEAFLMRKMAVKKFRGSMTLARFFRKIVRARRQMREEDERQRLLKDGILNIEKNTNKSRLNGSLIIPNIITTTPTIATTTKTNTIAQTPITRNIRRIYGPKLTTDPDQTLHNNGVQSTPTAAMLTHNNTMNNKELPTSLTPHVTTANSTRRVTISNTITECTLPTSTTAATTSRPKFQPPQLPITPTLKPPSDPNSSHKIIPQERLRSLEAPGPYDESKRREELTTNALNLIARVNRGKILNDTMQNSRLIPTQSVPNLSNKQAKMRKFATKQYEFLNTPNQQPPQSLIKSSSDVFVGPIPKRVTQKSYITTSSNDTINSMNGSEKGGFSATASYDGDGFISPVLSRSTSSLPLSTTAASMGERNLRSSYDLAGGAGILNPHTTTSTTSSRLNSPHLSALRSTGANVINHHSIPSSTTAASATGTATPSMIHSNYHSNASSRRASAIGSPESVGSKPLGTASLLHLGEVHSTPGTAGHGGVAALIRYNSTGLTLKSKKQQEAHEKAENERIQLRSVLYKYM